MRDLIKCALDAMENAYAPYSEFKVGAALIAKNQTGDCKIFYGCNVENGSFGATICAERVAMTKAVSEGYRVLLKIAIVSSKGEFTYPCGVCRQFLDEFSTDDTKVILYKTDIDEVIELKFKDLFPDGFSFH